MDVDTTTGARTYAADLDETLAQLLAPAERFIITHAVGYGEADVGEISQAFEDARAVSQVNSPRP